MVARITELRPEITNIMATLVLPRAPDRRSACLNQPFGVRFNREAGRFKPPASSALSSESHAVLHRPRLGMASTWPGTGSRRGPSEFLGCCPHLWPPEVPAFAEYGEVAVNLA
ncbi:hypothetical protein MTO96_046444 [Rhipicephalus appendiculatus]